MKNMYDNLRVREYMPNDFDTKVYTEDNDDKYLFSLNLEMAKCECIDNVNLFLNNVKDKKEFFFCKNEVVKQPIGLILKSYPMSFSYLENNEGFKEILKEAEAAGFKAHNAKNLFLRIDMKTPEKDIKTNRKLDIFINSHELFCKKFSRRLNNKLIRFALEQEYEQYGTNGYENNKSVKFFDSIILFDFFRSTLNRETILASMEFCKLIYDFCKYEIILDDLFIENGNMENHFKAYVQEKSKYMFNYMKRQDIFLAVEKNYFNVNIGNQYKNCEDVTIDNLNENNWSTNDTEWNYLSDQQDAPHYNSTAIPF